MSRIIFLCFALNCVAIVAACTTTAHSKTLTPEIEPADSPLTSSEILDWPAEGRWVEFVLDREGIAVGNASYFWSLRFYVLPNGSIEEAIEKRDHLESNLLVDHIGEDDEVAYSLSGSSLSDWGFTLTEAIRRGDERVLILTYEPEWGPTWIVRCD